MAINNFKAAHGIRNYWQCFHADGVFKLIAVSANGEAQTNHLAASDVGRNPAPTNEEEESELGRSRSPEPEPVGFEAAVECPICQGAFPAGRIERHAAYCNGEVETSAMDDLRLADERSQGWRKTSQNSSCLFGLFDHLMSVFLPPPPSQLEPL